MKKTILALSTIAALVAAPITASADEAELLQRVTSLQPNWNRSKRNCSPPGRKPRRSKSARMKWRPRQPRRPLPRTAPQPRKAALGPQTVLTGYGEVNYNRPTKDPIQAQTDLRRAVIGIQHRFDDKTKLVTEFEWEHAVTSADDAGESEVEQLYIERELDKAARQSRAVPDPGGPVEYQPRTDRLLRRRAQFRRDRNHPFDWREAGLGLSSTLDNGLTWDVGLTTGFDLAKWDAASTEGRQSPLGSIHQEGQLAKSRSLSVHAALNWRGVPGLLLGGSIFSGGAGQGSANFAAPKPR